MSERIVLKGSDAARVETAAWQARGDALRRRMVDDGHDEASCVEALRTAFGDVTFRDAERRVWRHDGIEWWCWDAPTWTSATPPAELCIDSIGFEMEAEVEPEVVEPDGGSNEQIGRDDAGAVRYTPTHVAPADGLWAWTAPDPATSPVARLDPGLDVQLLTQRDDGWARVRCSNGWEAWVDGRVLV